MASPSSTKVTMKLLIDTKNEKVLFAEASKAVIDFLFNLLCLPIGTVVKLLSKNAMVGSLGNLYQSVEDLNQNYMQPGQEKNVLLNPSTQFTGGLLLTHQNDDDAADDAFQGARFYTCAGTSNTYNYYQQSHCSNDVACYSSTLCSGCSKPMTRELRLVGKKFSEEKINSMKSGFVKDVVTFMVMDDLVVQPMSTISSITLLNKFNVKEIDTLQEKLVDLGMDEGIKLLKASLQSKMVLTSVFIKKQC